jgi:hypothetical protein
MMKQLFQIILALACLQGALAGEREPLRELVEVRRVRAPVLLEERAPGGCDQLSPGDIEVLEDGKAAAVLRLDTGGRRAVHTILIDTGPRLLGAIQEARKASLAYVGSLPRNEPALLATFDQRLILHSSLSTDRDRFARDLEWIETGGGSHLWDATRQVIEYLRSRPERKVLLLVTDGCDTFSGGRNSALQIIEQAARTESLVIFPIGFNVPERCEGDDSDPALLLETLAEQTGGQFLRPKSASQLREIFDSVRARMERERYVTYEPLPFGEGPKDSPGKRSYRWRKVKLRTAKGAECKARLAGSPLRYESAGRNYFGAVPAPANASDGETFRLDQARGRLVGKLIDIVRESGPIAPSLDLLFGLQPDRPEEKEELRESREVVTLIPPFAEVVRPEAEPYDAIRQALALSGQVDGLAEAGRWSDVPFLVNGRTLLDARRALALALWQEQEYRGWAFERVRRDRLKAIDELIAAPETEQERKILQRARSYLAEQEWEPTPAEVEMRLGAWLGDIPVAGAFSAAELWVAQSFIGAVREHGPERTAEAALGAARAWERFSTWFPEPEDVRLIGLLVPAYDSAQEAVGYYRIILTSPYSATIHQSLIGASLDTFLGSGGKDISSKADGSLYRYLQSFNYSRQAPLGTHLLHWMLQQEGAGGALLERFDVREVRYAHPGPRDLMPVLLKNELIDSVERDDIYLARYVSVVLESRSEPGQLVTINAYIQKDPASGAFLEEPLCLLPPAQPPAFAEGRELWGSLVAAKSRSDLPCVLLSRQAE